MTLNEFLKNPVGSGDTSTNTKIISSTLNSKYYDLLKSGKKIKCIIYKDKYDYYYHLTIPSETGRGNSYDVVIQFIGNKGLAGSTSSVKDYPIKLFSNSPAFAYTYANAYKKNDLLVDCLTKKFESQMVKKPAKVRNRYGIIGYDKYLYFGAKHIQESNLLSKEIANSLSVKFSRKLFVDNIRSIDKIMHEYSVAEKKNKSKNTFKEKNLSEPNSRKKVPGSVVNYVTGINKHSNRITKRTGRKK